MTEDSEMEWNETESAVLAQLEEGHRHFTLDGGELRGYFVAALLIEAADEQRGVIKKIHIESVHPPVSSDHQSEVQRAVRIVGEIHLPNVTAKDGQPLPSLTLEKCFVEDRIDLTGAQMTGLDLRGSHISLLFADQVSIVRDVCLDGVHSEECISFIGASIGGRFSAQQASLLAADFSAIRLTGAQIGGGLDISESHIEGFADFSEIKLAGVFEASKLEVIGESNYALCLEHAEISGGIHLNEAVIQSGPADFRSMSSQGRLWASGSVFSNPTGVALDMTDSHIRGDIMLNDTCVYGLFDGSGLSTSSALTATNARFYNKTGRSICMKRASVEGEIFFYKTRCWGSVDFEELATNGGVKCYQCWFINDGGIALSVENARNSRGLFIRECTLRGILYGPYSEANELSLYGSMFHAGPHDTAIVLIGARIKNDLSFTPQRVGPSDPPARVWGCVNLDYAHIGGRCCLNGTFFKRTGEGESSITMRRTRIDGSFETRDLGCLPEGTFDLGGAEIDTIDNDPVTGWPQAGQVNLDELTYRFIKAPTGSSEGAVLAAERLAWLKRQYKNGEPSRGEFRPQPFEHMAKILRGQGHDYAAMKVSIEKRELQRKYADRGFARFMHTILKTTSDYGYSPVRALAWFGGWVIGGGLLALVALQLGMFERASIDFPEASHLEPFVYAFDLATPILDFGQASTYRLKPSCMEVFSTALCNGWEIVEVTYSIFGFVLFSILVLTLSGVLRRDSG